jgi:hypothetical protein
MGGGDRRAMTEGVAGRRQTVKARVRRWVLGQVFAAADRDIEVAPTVPAGGFTTVHPRSLAAPGVVARAVPANRRPAGRQPRAEAPDRPTAAPTARAGGGAASSSVEAP